MLIEKDKFQKKFLEVYLSDSSVSPWAVWKSQVLINESETHYLPESDSWYAVYNKMLFIYISHDRKCHIPVDELNALDCICIPADIFAGIKDKLTGFEAPNYAWGLHYDKNYNPPELHSDFCIAEFDFSNEEHYKLAAYMIDQEGDWINAENIKKIKSQYISSSVFDPSLWFFIQDKQTKKLIGNAISSYQESVRETNLDWIHILPEYQGRGAGRLMMQEIIRHSLNLSDVISVGGTVEFYRKCGFCDFSQGVWIQKPGYSLIAPSIQP